MVKDWKKPVTLSLKNAFTLVYVEPKETKKNTSVVLGTVMKHELSPQTILVGEDDYEDFPTSHLPTAPLCCFPYPRGLPRINWGMDLRIKDQRRIWYLLKITSKLFRLARSGSTDVDILIILRL